MNQNKKISWKPEEEFTITGLELEGLLKLGDLFLISKASLSKDLEMKVYMKFLEAKETILERLISEGKLTEEEVN